MGITMKRATIKSCMPYQELHDLLLCRGRLGNSFPGSLHRILKVTKRRMAIRASSWQGAHTWAQSSCWYCFCPLTSLSSSLRLQWLQRRSRNQTSFFVGVSAASDRISKKENMHLLSVFPCLSFSYLFSSLFCIFPSQIFQFYSNQISTTSPYFGFQKTTLSYFLFCASVNLRDQLAWPVSKQPCIVNESSVISVPSNIKVDQDQSICGMDKPY